MFYIVDFRYIRSRLCIESLSILDTDDNTVEDIKLYDFIKVYPSIKHLLGTKAYFEPFWGSSMLSGHSFIPETVSINNPYDTPVLRLLLEGLDLHNIFDIQELSSRAYYKSEDLTILSFCTLILSPYEFSFYHKYFTKVYSLVNSFKLKATPYSTKVYYLSYCYMRDKIIKTRVLTSEQVDSYKFLDIKGVVKFTDTFDKTYLLEFNSEDYAKMVFFELQSHTTDTINAVREVSTLFIEELGKIKVIGLHDKVLELKPTNFKSAVYLLKNTVLRR